MSETAYHEYIHKESVNVGVVGATGLVGGHMLDILAERDFPVDNLRVFASSRSAGQSLGWQDRKLFVEDASQASYKGLDIVFFSAGGQTSKQLAPHTVEAGATVIDNSSAWRGNPDVPLVVSEVNPEAIRYRPLGIVANPNCSTMIIIPVLGALHKEATLEAVSITTQQAVSGAGERGTRELEDQILGGTRIEVFPEPTAYNVIPLRGELMGKNTDEELKLLSESRKILGIANLAVEATCTTVPVVTGHSMAIQARFKNNISPERAEDILANAPGVRLVDIPTPLKAAGGDISLVGRVRQSSVIGKNGLLLFVSGDNLRKGAALNAIQLGELLLRIA